MFDHPYAYAAYHGVDTSVMPAPPEPAVEIAA